MTTLLVDERDQLFVLDEMLGISGLCRFPKFAEHTESEFHMVLTEAHKFARSELLPTNAEADRKGCEYDPGTLTVKFPQCLRKPFEQFREAGWLAMSDSADVGGANFPLTVGTAVSEVFYAGSFYLYGAAKLSHAGARAIEKFGTDEQKALYMARLFSGEWMGTMCLTEPQAGSDVGAIRTSAMPQPDGTYLISGTKIFITAGEHDLTDNIIHMVLARVVGDSPGIKGLSLFIVPKYLVDQAGKIDRRNDVSCVGVERKMGLHGLPTCSMAYGDKGQCTGYLLGERGKGIEEMFNMMNEQRLLVGLEGLSCSSAAFLHAVDYAAKRIQGVSVYPSEDGRTAPVAIINHPDIKRMLLTMKAYVEGCRALAYFTSYCIDLASVTHDEDSARWWGLVELLTPIVKAYLTTNAWEVTGMAMQCAGGYGYCSEYPFERLARDCKVTAIFEGTNGIQSIDLMFRKLIGNELINFKRLMERIDQSLQSADQIEGLRVYAATIKEAKNGLEEVVEHFVERAEGEGILHLYAKATPFLEAMGDVILGWIHLWQLTIAYPRLMGCIGGKPAEEAHEIFQEKSDCAYYHGKVMASKFYIGTIMKRTLGKLAELKTDSSPILEVFDKSFTG